MAIRMGGIILPQCFTSHRITRHNDARNEFAWQSVSNLATVSNMVAPGVNQSNTITSWKRLWNAWR
jgi:hypothetical protein